MITVPNFAINAAISELKVYVTKKSYFVSNTTFHVSECSDKAIFSSEVLLPHYSASKDDVPL
jgi:hypothetical protein